MERKISEKVVFNGRLLKVVLRKVVVNEERESERELVFHPGAVGIIPVKGESVVLVKQFRSPIEEELVEIPAGKLKKGEDPEECAKRELLEIYEAIPEAFAKVKEFPKRPKYLSLDELEVYRLELPLHDKPLWRLSKIMKPLTEKDYEKFERRVREWGMEALAWYRPFHYLPKELWGIYITLDGLKYLIQKLRHSIRLSVATAILYAVEILWQHELFHFIVEVFSTRVEFITREPKYLPYLRQFYEATWPNCLEEALANRHVLRRRNLNKAKRFLYAFFDQQPGWYREYRRFLAPDKFREGRIELCNQIVFSSHLHLPINELRPPARFNVRNTPTFIVA